MGDHARKWMVMSLAYRQLAAAKNLPEVEADRHKKEARHLYDQAVKEIPRGGLRGRFRGLGHPGFPR